jgi:uncharacterized protein YigE (DUF2233 family)
MMAAALSFAYLTHPSRKGSREAITHYTGRDRFVKVVDVDPKRTQVRVALAKKDGAYGESFSGMIERLRPAAAINGTLYGRDMVPLGDVVVDGKVMVRGGYKNALAVTSKGKVSILRRTKRTRFGWSGYKYGVASGPRLVHEGKIACDPVAEGFSKRSRTIEAWRCGAGITKSGRLLLVTVTRDVTLAQFARTMLNLGCVEAMNLDGGGACALYHNGRTLVSPNLPMTNIVTVYEGK